MNKLIMKTLFWLSTGAGLTGLVMLVVMQIIGIPQIIEAHAAEQSATVSYQANGGNFTNSIGMKFIGIPAGSFYMGSCKLSAADKEENNKRLCMGLAPKHTTCSSGCCADNDASDDEIPQHKVRISNAFQIGMYEVTLGQFKQFIAGANRGDLLNDEFMKNNSHGDNAALMHVSWHDAQAFIGWLNKKEGGNYYHLPTEAEWEYAARAGSHTIYPWGYGKSQAVAYTWYEVNTDAVGIQYAQAVGGKKPNAFGLYDMQGNVWEWVHDNWHNSYRGAPSDGSAWAGGDDQYRVVRGGGWSNGTKSLRSAARRYLSPSERGNGLGFRLVRQP